jgi:hypothetical protein
VTDGSDVRINKWLDLLDRTAWTAIQTFAGVLLATLLSGDTHWKLALGSAGIAAVIAACKAALGQQLGDGAGDLIPGQEVIETVEAARPASTR